MHSLWLETPPPAPHEKLWVRVWVQLQFDNTGYKGHKLHALPTIIHRQLAKFTNDTNK